MAVTASCALLPAPDCRATRVCHCLLCIPLPALTCRATLWLSYQLCCPACTWRQTYVVAATTSCATLCLHLAAEPHCGGHCLLCWLLCGAHCPAVVHSCSHSLLYWHMAAAACCAMHTVTVTVGAVPNFACDCLLFVLACVYHIPTVLMCGCLCLLCLAALSLSRVVGCAELGLCLTACTWLRL